MNAYSGKGNTRLSGFASLNTPAEPQRKQRMGSFGRRADIKAMGKDPLKDRTSMCLLPLGGRTDGFTKQKVTPFKVNDIESCFFYVNAKKGENRYFSLVILVIKTQEFSYSMSLSAGVSGSQNLSD